MSGCHPKALQALMSTDSVYPNHKPIMSALPLPLCVRKACTDMPR